MDQDLPPAAPKRPREGGRVFHMAGAVKIASAAAALLLCVVGGYLLWWEPNLLYRAAGAVMLVLGIGGFADVLVSRIILEQDAIHIISLVRKRSYPRADFESARVDGGLVCLKRRDGGWLVLPGTGLNSLGMRNTIDAWIKAGS